MEELQYVGELLWPKQVGHFLLIIAFTTTFLCAWAYYKSIKTKQESWAKLGRIAYLTHGFSILGVIAIIFGLMYTHHYEYYYVYNHVSDDLPLRYLFSSFWEGQEGSFMLWMFWHIVLGFIFIFRKDKWEAPVVMTLAMIEFFFAFMILGIHVPWFGGEIKFGSSPITLLRDTMDIPLFANANYVELITGTGLNPLLQNYWMTIHPPIIFLGFASVSIPFAFVIGGMISKDYTSWKNVALKWSLFSAGILGTGIFMGGLWAYEALGFGGYWAWDPVENASLVPWLFMVAAVHTHLIWKHTNYSARTTFVFYILSFLFIIYSTFLTRSGILGDTSVHAFTEMGLENQLILFMAFFAILSFVLYWINRSKIETPREEEKYYSREFWMLIGSIVLFFSGVLIIGATSLPVFNSLIINFYDPNFNGWVITDDMAHYNKYQLWVGFFIALLSGATQFLRYGGFNWSENRKKFHIRFVISIAISIALGLLLNNYFTYTSWQIKAFTIAGIYALIANIDFIISILKGNLKLSGSVFSHFGFGVLIIGILISGINQSYISNNPFVQTGLVEDGKEANNIKIFKNTPALSKGHVFTYESDTLEGNLRHFDINIKRVAQDMTIEDEYTLRPSAVYANDFSKIASWNPDKKHYIEKDIFVNMTGYPAHLTDIESARMMEDTLNFVPYTLLKNKTLNYQHGDSARADIQVKFKGINFAPNHKDLKLDDVDIAAGISLEIYDAFWDSTFVTEPALALKNNLIYQYPSSIDPLYSRIKVDERFFDQLFTQVQDQDISTLELKEGESAKWNGYEIRLNQLVRDPQLRAYEPDSSDIAIGANLTFLKAGKEKVLQPIYLIRDNQQLSIKDYEPVNGISARFAKLNPETGAVELQLSQDNRVFDQVPLLICNDVPRSDLVVIEARVFPGINLVWVGCILMLIGFFMSVYRRYSSKN